MNTETVRKAYLRGAITPDAPIATLFAVERAFNRWLAEERRAAAEKAWTEGFDLGDGVGTYSSGEIAALNPYRAKETKA